MPRCTHSPGRTDVPLVFRFLSPCFSQTQPPTTQCCPRFPRRTRVPSPCPAWHVPTPFLGNPVSSRGLLWDALRGGGSMPLCHPQGRHRCSPPGRVPGQASGPGLHSVPGPRSHVCPGSHGWPLTSGACAKLHRSLPPGEPGHTGQFRTKLAPRDGENARTLGSPPSAEGLLPERSGVCGGWQPYPNY